MVLTDPRLLVARASPNGGLYAIEQVKDNVYTFHLLHNWITENDLRDAVNAIPITHDLDRMTRTLPWNRDLGISTKPTESTSTFRLSRTQSPRQPRNRKGVLARESILGAKDTSLHVDPIKEGRRNVERPSTEPRYDSDEKGLPESTVARTCELSSLSSATSHGHLPDGAILPPDNSRIAPESPKTITETGSLDFEELRGHYLETLYLSKTSLAYFAKGPLSRARTRVHSSTDSVDARRLADCYRDSVLPTKKMDMKYRDALAKVVKATIQKDTSPQKEGGQQAASKKSRTKKKLGKDGLYPGEDDFVAQWWRARESTTAAVCSTEAEAQELKRMASDLRMRETGMQILLILEVFLLETMATKSKAASAPPCDIKTDDIAEDAKMILARTPDRKKSRDLKAELELLLDRLCIWHSVNIDERSTTSVSPTRPRAASTSSKDKLRDFCVDVIIPFYGSRLAEQSTAICRKLGGPDISPKRTKPVAVKPGATSRRSVMNFASKQEPPKSRRTLERVLSEDQTSRHASPPVLSRSSTISMGSHSRRDSLEVSQRPPTRGGMQRSVSFSNREVDLVADARAHDAKRQKLARIASHKQELEAAINVLKKPNRSIVAQTFMDELEQRRCEKKSSVLKSGDQLVQISATPKRHRTSRIDMSESTADLGLACSAVVDEPLVPSSTVRPRMPAPQSAMKQAVLTAIQSTPSRNSVRPVVWTNHEESMRAVPTTRMWMTKSQRPVLMTPLKKTEVRVEEAFRDLPEIPEDAGKAMDRVMRGGQPMSIYDTLGWNDDLE